MKYGTSNAVEVYCYCTGQECIGAGRLGVSDDSDAESSEPLMIAWEAVAYHTVTRSRQHNLGRRLAASWQNSGFSTSDIAQNIHCEEKDLGLVVC